MVDQSDEETWQFWQFDNLENVWQLWQFWKFMTICNIFDNLWQFWQFMNILTISDFLTISYIVVNRWQFLTIVYNLTICQYWPILANKTNTRTSTKRILETCDIWDLGFVTFENLNSWNLCDLTFNSDTGENSQFLRCFITSLASNLSMAGSPKKWKNMATRIAWSKIRPMGKILEIILWIRNWTEKAFLKNVHCAIDDWLRHIFVAFVALTMYF